MSKELFQNVSKTALLKSALLAAAVFGSPAGCMMLVNLPAVSLPGAFEPLMLVTVMATTALILIWLGIAISAPIGSLVCLLAKEQRSKAGLWLAAWILSWGSFGGSFILREPINQWRMNAMRRAAARGTVLIEAIEKFHADNGRYPEKAGELIPRYLAEMPFTGMAGYPEFKYLRISHDDRSPTYRIWVSTPRGMMNFDSLLYHSDKQYDKYGSGIERLGDWAYHHE